MPKAQRQPERVPVPRSRFIAQALAVSFLIPFLVLLPMMALEVRLGQGYFAYRYSPVRSLRSTRMLAVLPVIASTAVAVWMLARRDRRLRRAGIAVLAVALLGAGGWVWWAPPSPVNQQFFNARSFSTDGAFVFESEKIDAIGPYLRQFDSGTLKQSPAEMGGTRVLSNPPGTTILAYAILRAFPPGMDRYIERSVMQAEGATAADALPFGHALRVSFALTLAWLAAGAVAYALGRLFLSLTGAAVFAVVLTFNPCTVHFVPGKDPGQLLTINAMLWAWFAGWQRRSKLLASLAGALLVIGSTFGLVHIWVAMIALLATTWEDLRAAHSVGKAARRDAVRGTIMSIAFAAAGGIAVVALVYLAIGWNIPATLLAVSARWGELQRTFDMSRAIWFAIGLPIFLLFLGPGLYALIGLSLRRQQMNFGTRLAISTAAVMLLIYVVMGVTYELPRLWVAFVPTLILGMAIDSPLFRGRGKHRRVAAALALIVIVQMAFTAFHWTLFDAREAEYRLVSERYFN